MTLGAGCHGIAKRSMGFEAKCDYLAIWTNQIVFLMHVYAFYLLLLDKPGFFFGFLNHPIQFLKNKTHKKVKKYNIFGVPKN